MAVINPVLFTILKCSVCGNYLPFIVELHTVSLRETNREREKERDVDYEGAEQREERVT